MKAINYFCLSYLNSWIGFDLNFHLGINSSSEEKKLRAIRDACSYYGISRNFKWLSIETEKTRMITVLDELENTPLPNQNNINCIVMDFAKRLTAKYGKGKISAASKLLWIKHQNDIVLYDRQAVGYLLGLGYRFDVTDYSGYRTAWCNEFQVCRSIIAETCEELTPIKLFSLAREWTDEELTALTRKSWFHQRVFDKLAWTRGRQ